MHAVSIYRSSIGKKIIMALSGAVWIGYVVMHMYGNLKWFSGEAAYNGYAEGLRSLGGPVFGHLHFLILARIVFVVSIVLHIWAAYTLYRRAANARPQSYATRKVVQADYAARTMRYGGVVVALFLLFHLAQLTWGVDAVNSEFVLGDPYNNLIHVFQSPINTAFYLLALIVLGAHLYHGAWSMFQTLGLNSQRFDYSIRILAWVLAIGVPLGFATVPIAIQFNMWT